MKKFFKTKEAGTITPLPPANPGAVSSSFATPRPFEEYQAKLASQTGESNRPLSLQVPPSATRSASNSLDHPGAYPQTYSPTSSSQQRRSSQQLGVSPRKNRSANQIHPSPAADAAYVSYSDLISSNPQQFRASYDRNNTSDYDLRSSPRPQRANSKRYSQQQQMPPPMAAFSPPMSLRPAHPTVQHRRDNSMTMVVAPAGPLQGQSQGTGSRNSLSVPSSALAPPDSSRATHRPASNDSYQAGYNDNYDDDDDGDGRTPTASDPARSAAYPVYSGADGDEDAGGEVLISQGRYEETTLRELSGRDKGKGRKLFAFATGSGKDRKAKQDHEITATTPSPIPRDSRDRDDYRLMSPSVDSQPLPVQERSKEGGWMDRWNKRAHQHQAARLQDKEVEEAVASRIGWLSANAYDEQDWVQIFSLLDMVSHSDAASKEAARALRKEFRYGSVDTQRRAVRIWALLTLHSSDRFRLQIASKRFLEAIEDTIASPKTPLSVKDTMLRVLGVLAFEFRNDAELVSVTKCWNKVKPNDRQKDGEPLENDLFEFRLPQSRGPLQQELQQQQQQPASRRVSQRHSQPPRRGVAYHDADFDHLLPPQQQPLTADSAVQQHQQLQLPSATFAPPPPQQPPAIPASLQPQMMAPQHHHSQQQPWSRPNPPPPMMANTSSGGSGPDVVSTLEAAAASMDSRSASMQSVDSSLSAHHDVLTFDEDVRRLHEECQIARSNAAVLLDTLLHEGLYSDTMEVVEEFYSKVVRSSDLIASQIAWASAQADRSRAALAVSGGETREEALLADLLEAHGRSTEAIRMVEDAKRRVEEEEAERRVTERSKVEVRLDRSALAQDGVTGELYDVRGNGGLLGVQASGSRSPSPSAAYGSHRQQQMAVVSPNNARAAVFNASASPLSNDHTAAAAAGSGILPPRISRPLPVPRSDRSSDSNNSTHSFHPTAHSLTASIHSTTSTTTASSHHSRDAPLHSQGQPNGRSPLPLTPPALNIDTTQPAAKAEAERTEHRPDDDDEDELQTPVVPSAKALGKRRAVSVRYPTPPPVQQAVPPALPPHPTTITTTTTTTRMGAEGTMVNGFGGMHLGN